MNYFTPTNQLLTQKSLLKIALVAREKCTNKQIADKTDLSEAYIRKMLVAHKEHFQFTGYVMNEQKTRPLRQFKIREGVIEQINRNIDDLQKQLAQSNKSVPEAIPQGVRRIVFDDSTEYGKELCKKLAATWRTRRANDKVYVSGSTLS